MYLSNLVKGVAESWKKFQNWDESGCCRDGKEAESVIDETHETLESRIIVRETDAHQQGANHIAYR